MKRLIAGLVFAAVLQAQAPATHTQTAGSQSVVVYVTSHSKVYHTWRDCARLDGARVLVASEADAEQHGLIQCRICAHRHHSAVVGGKNENWAKAEVTR